MKIVQETKHFFFTPYRPYRAPCFALKFTAHFRHRTPISRHILDVVLWSAINGMLRRMQSSSTTSKYAECHRMSKGVASHTVSTVNSACHFAAGIETVYFRFPVRADLYSAAEIMFKRRDPKRRFYILKKRPRQ